MNHRCRGLAVLLCIVYNCGLARGQAVNAKYKLTAREIVQERVKAVVANNAERGAIIKRFFAAAGCAADRLELQPVEHTPVPNVICTIPGETDSEIVVGAHFDHVARGLGVIDNWSGAALLPSLLESVKSGGRRHTFVFIAFTDEEKGLVGSKYYVEHLSAEDLQRIVAMINFDSIGAGPTEIEERRADPDLRAKLLSVVATLKLKLSYVNVPGGDSDFSSFRAKHVPTIIFHSLTRESIGLIHTDNDNMAAFKMDDYYDTYRVAAVYLSYLDLTLDATPRAGK